MRGYPEAGDSTPLGWLQRLPRRRPFGGSSALCTSTLRTGVRAILLYTDARLQIVVERRTAVTCAREHSMQSTATCLTSCCASRGEHSTDYFRYLQCCAFD